MMAEAARTNWFTVVSLFCAGLVASMQFAKLSPVMKQVAVEFSASDVMAGLFVSVLGLVGVILAITVATFANAVGLARCLRIALFGGGIVAVVSAFAPEANSFLASRFLEGLSHLFIVVCAPTLMAEAAHPADRPVALSLWGCFFGAGYAITSAAAPIIIESAGWRGLLVAHAATMLIVAVLVTFATWRNIDRTETFAASTIIRKHIEALTSGAPLLLAVTFFAYTIQFLAALTFLVIFLDDVVGWTQAQVGLALAVAPLWSLLFTFAAGFLVKTGLGIQTGFIATFVTLAAATVYIFGFEPSGAGLFAGLAIMMACFGLLPGLTFANLPAIAPTAPRAMLAYSGIALFGNLGTFLGTPLLAQMKVVAGWSGVAAVLVAICLAGVCVAMMLARRVAQEQTQTT